MPFTLSHPAIVLPIIFLPKKWFSYSGLIVGSMTPDFEYFIRMQVKSIYSHTFPGVVWFNLPLGIFLLFIFHNLIKGSLIVNLPIVIKGKCSELYQLNWNKYFIKNWFVVLYSLLIGSASHIFWDGFTHSHGFFVELITFLSLKITLINIEIPFYKILQHLSIIVGGLIIIFVIKKLPVIENINEKINYKYWYFVILLSVLITMIRISNGLSIYQYGNLIVTIISTTLISLTLTPLLFKRFITT